MVLRSRILRSGFFLSAIGVFCSIAIGCGSSGASGGGGTNPPLAGDFSISATPASVSLDSGGSQTVTISVAEINTYTATVNVAVAGLPKGVTASPGTFDLAPGSQQTVTLQAAANAAAGVATVMFQGTSGSLSHSAQEALNVVESVTAPHPPIRAQYLRTNSSSYSEEEAPPHFAVYDPAHRQFFVSNPYLNEIDVFSAASETETATISVPTAWGLDISPLDGTLYAGTLLGDLYHIDTSTLSVMTRYPASSIGPDGFTATTALVLADGRLVLQGGAGGILGVDGFGVNVIWDPSTNSIDAGPTNSGYLCNGNGGIALDGTRTLVLVTTVDSGGGPLPLCSYDIAARVATYATYVPSQPTFVRQIIPTPDGTKVFVTTNLDGIDVFDPKTLQLLGQIPSQTSTASDTSSLPNAAAGAVMSLDGKTFYLVDQIYAVVAGYDTTSFQQVNWVPAFRIEDSQGVILISAIDETGLIAGPVGHGVGFIDAGAPTTGSSSTAGSLYPIAPATGAPSGGTQIQALTNLGLQASIPNVSAFYFGNVPSQTVTEDQAANLELSVDATSPPAAQTGAVDLTSIYADGTIAIAPEAFSYGPTILEVVPNGATAEGGQTGSIIGYGFGSAASGVQVIIGGRSATVTAAYGQPPLNPYPFPTTSLQFTIPPGTAGAAVDVTVTTPSGSTTATDSFHYTAALQSYPVTASLQAGLYDAGRDLYYFADKAQIQVLSKSSGTWLSSIPLPGVSSKTQLLAISESPDGSKLAVSDFGGQSIYVLNPDSPASAKTYPMPLDYFDTSLLAPDGLAVTNDGTVYFATADIGGTGTPAFHELTLATGAIIDLGTTQSGGIVDQEDRVILSPDGSRVYSSIEGESFWLDTSNNAIHYSVGASSNDGGIPDLAVSGDGTTVAIDGFLADPSLNPETEPAYVDWETWFPTGLTGQKLNQDGSILFQPLTDGLDLIARNTGRLLYRIQTPVTPANVYDPLVVADGQNTLAIITAAGVSFVDLSGLPIPASDTHPFATYSKGNGPSGTRSAPPVRNLISGRSFQTGTRPRIKRQSAHLFHQQ